jgi:hypothetical protein
MENIIKETKYLIFEAYNMPRRKSKNVQVINKSSGDIIATIEWYGAWRQYCFMPSNEFCTVWNNTCLSDIIEVINQLMKERTIEKPEGE